MSDSEILPRRGIKVTGLTVRRGERLLFANLGFEIAAGDVLLLRGPNGAGKSSLLLTLAGALRPEAGTIAITGRDGEARDGIDLHLLGHQSAAKPQLTVAENLDAWAALLGGPPPGEAPLALVGLGGLGHLPTGYLSAGQTRRLALARLIAVPRPIWLLDEPTSALDAEGEALVGRLVTAHAERGGMAIAATHHDLALGVAGRTLTLGSAP